MDGWWENQWSFSTYRMAKSSLEKHLLLYGFSSLENFGAWSLRRLSLNAAPQYKQIPARNCWPGKVSATLQTLSKLLMYYFDGVGCPINAFKVRCPFNWVCQDYNWLLPWENKSCKLQRCIYSFFLSFFDENCIPVVFTWKHDKLVPTSAHLHRRGSSAGRIWNTVHISDPTAVFWSVV